MIPSFVKPTLTSTLQFEPSASQVLSTLASTLQPTTSVSADDMLKHSSKVGYATHRSRLRYDELGQAFEPIAHCGECNNAVQPANTRGGIHVPSKLFNALHLRSNGAPPLQPVKYLHYDLYVATLMRASSYTGSSPYELSLGLRLTQDANPGRLRTHFHSS